MSDVTGRSPHVRGASLENAEASAFRADPHVCGGAFPVGCGPTLLSSGRWALLVEAAERPAHVPPQRA